MYFQSYTYVYLNCILVAPVQYNFSDNNNVNNFAVEQQVKLPTGIFSNISIVTSVVRSNLKRQGRKQQFSNVSAKSSSLAPKQKQQYRVFAFTFSLGYNILILFHLK